MTRRKTDGQEIAERFYGYEILKSVDYIDRLIRRRMAEAWDDGYEDHRQMIEGIARKPSNPYR